LHTRIEKKKITEKIAAALQKDAHLLALAICSDKLLLTADTNLHTHAKALLDPNEVEWLLCDAKHVSMCFSRIIEIAKSRPSPAIPA
jgi:predicted nuclease of predicted toxin-antitoxin system